jgi:hypothetical protein
VLPRFLPNPDLVLVLEGVRPTFPLGIRVKTITLQHPHWRLEAVESRLVWLVVRFWVETRIAGGALRSRGTGLGGSGIVRLDGVQLRELPLQALAASMAFSSESCRSKPWPDSGCAVARTA